MTKRKIELMKDPELVRLTDLGERFQAEWDKWFSRAKRAMTEMSKRRRKLKRVLKSVKERKSLLENGGDL